MSWRKNTRSWTLPPKQSCRSDRERRAESAGRETRSSSYACAMRCLKLKLVMSSCYAFAMRYPGLTLAVLVLGRERAREREGSDPRQDSGGGRRLGQRHEREAGDRESEHPRRDRRKPQLSAIDGNSSGRCPRQSPMYELRPLGAAGARIGLQHLMWCMCRLAKGSRACDGHRG